MQRLCTALIFVASLYSVGIGESEYDVVSFMQSKKGPQAVDLCEDGLFISSRYLVVVDGASDKTGKLYGGHTGGWHGKEAALDAFRGLQGGEPPEKVLSSINRALRQRYEKFGIDYEKDQVHRFSASLIWYDIESRTLYAVGDCKARIDGTLYNEQSKAIDELNAEIRIGVLQSLGIDIRSTELRENDPGRQYILPLLREQPKYQNNPDADPKLAYWVVDGTDIPKSEIRTWSFDKAPDVIELSSDGYALFPEEATVESYEAELAGLLKEDPNLTWKVVSTKGLKKGNSSFDDRCVVIARRRP